MSKKITSQVQHFTRIWQLLDDTTSPKAALTLYDVAFDITTLRPPFYKCAENKNNMPYGTTNNNPTHFSEKLIKGNEGRSTMANQRLTRVRTSTLLC